MQRLLTSAPAVGTVCGLEIAFSGPGRPWLTTPVRNPVIAALDVPTAERALELAGHLAPDIGALKVGKELFTSAGPELVRQLRATGAAVFLDLKFHDIPNTVARAVEAAVRLDVQMLTMHTSGGLAMMKAAVEAAEAAARQCQRPAPLLLGVTVLTSLDDASLKEVGIDRPVAAQVEWLARLAVRAGVRGLVCSPQELGLLRSVLPRDIQLVTPGIRPAGAALGDQKRTLTPRQAMAAGADWLVVGRPIVAAPDPRAALRELLASLA
ncbi:MAG: orotidine-5'-phosphate decarboxylase [Verrucomicrobia bacterium]|nr:orotidine-5'-phosphate decarboxylase [Verrucomicrobiota bacterium]